MKIAEFFASTTSNSILLLLTIVILAFMVFYLRQLIKSLSSDNKFKNQKNTNNPGQIMKMQIQDAGKNELELKRVLRRELDFKAEDCYSIPSGSLNKDSIVNSLWAFSPIGTLMETGPVKAFNLNGLYTATVNPRELARFSNSGNLSTMIHGQNGIIGHAGFKTASLSVFGPIIIYQVLSILTAQHYLKDISKQFHSIDKKLEKLLKHSKVQEIARINNSVKQLKALFEIQYPNVEDMVILKLITNDLSILHEEFIYQLAERDFKEKFEITKWRTSKRLKELLFKIDDYEFDFNLKMAITTDELVHLTYFVELILNARMLDNIENRSNRINEIMDQIRNWHDQEFFKSRYADEVIAEYYSIILEQAQVIYEQAYIHRKQAKNTINELTKKQEMLEENIGGRLCIIEMGKKFIEKIEIPIKIFYRVDGENGDLIMIKK